MKIGTAKWSTKSQRLIVKGRLKNAQGNQPVELYDLEGRHLGTARGSSFSLTLNGVDLASVPCGVRAQVGAAETVKRVVGNPSKTCRVMPTCQILSPASGAQISAGTDVPFSASAKFPNKKAVATYEWDFGGGVFGVPIPNTSPPAYERPKSLAPTVQFARNDAVFRVRFSAVDDQKHGCAASIDVAVGSPPTGLPDVSSLVSQSQQTAPAKGGQLAARNEGDIVILPYPELTMQAYPDARFQDNLYNPATPGPFNTVKAAVYGKSRQPKQLTDQDVALRYAAASNPADPVGSASINTTSQNYAQGQTATPVAWLDALIQKADIWEVPVRSTTQKADGYMAQSYMDINSWLWGTVKPDEGKKENETGVVPDHGSYMPGADGPYQVNAFQAFTSFDATSHAFSAHNIPVTDIDDGGRINPYPLMRIEAVDPKTNKPLANAPATDTVVAVAKDFHCAECHAKGKIAANPAVDYASFTNAYHSSPEYNQGYHCTPPTDCKDDFKTQGFYESVDKNGQPSNDLADQEYAAIRNAAAIHDFYDYFGMNYLMDGTQTADGKYGMDMVASCTWCHSTMINPIQLGAPFNTNPGKKSLDQMYYPSLSQAMHKFHGQLQLDPDDKSKILRKADGRPLLWDTAQGGNPNTLFPTTDGAGQSLPMEQSCLRCHSGHREQLFRDRMFTAGVTCYDCHGNMTAVGQAYDKAKPGPEGEANRVEWMDQPDCGSCHMGDGNVGKNNAEAFSAGVMKRVFNGDDPSAASRKPMTQRFAVRATEPQDIPKDDWVDAQYSTRHSILTLSKPLYRKSRDSHGDVACAACHGGAHEVWANRDPSANDNVTALQLQGHAGPIAECGVCHSADAFKLEPDLDGGQFMSDVAVDSGVLGGPHNMHPVNDPYWWQSAQDPADGNKDGTNYGGWHNNYAQKPGKNGEDQCAACHGKDHKGTRLSKTPVDRIFTFDFARSDRKALREAGITKSVIKVPAGTEIGCDTCHNIETSCIDSPAGDQCGVAAESPVAVDTNRDPVITKEITKLAAIMGEDYADQLQAEDPDGDTLTYSLPLKPTPIKDETGKIISELMIDANGNVTGNWPEALFAEYHHGPFIFPFAVNVSDGKGGYAVQNVELTLDCPAGKHWRWSGGIWAGKAGACVANGRVAITSLPDMQGIDAGATTYSYQVVASDSGGLPITYSLTDYPSETPDGWEKANYFPENLQIDPNTGLVTWTNGGKGAKTVWYGQASYQVKATNSNGDFDTQLVTITVCVPNKKWDAQLGVCK